MIQNLNPRRIQETNWMPIIGSSRKVTIKDVSVFFELAEDAPDAL